MMRRQRYDVPLSLRTPVLHRRAVLRGGLGLVMGAVVGGLQDDLDSFTVVEPEPEPPAAAPAPAPQPQDQQTPVEPEPAEPTEPVEPEPEPEAVPLQLRRGDHGPAVLALQTSLAAAGYWCGTPDGGFGHVTEQAVFAVQKAGGLVRDGVAGPATRTALEEGVRPRPAARGDHVEVHLGSQLLLVVRGGAPAIVLNTSTGNGEPYTFGGHDFVAHTPTGDFAVWFTDGSGWRDGELGRLYRPMFYDGNYAVHGSESIPPEPASHGCARVSTAAMDMIWEQGLLRMGSRVLVV